MLDNIEYLPKKSEFRLGDVKNLAVATNQKDDISKMYPKIEGSTLSNADMLSQSFGTNNSSVETSKVEQVSEPVQVSAIPNIQNTFNMEAKPVDLNPNPSLENINQSNVIPKMEASNLNIPSINEQVNNNWGEVNSALNNTPNVPIIEPIKTDINNNLVESGFKVSSEPNIFDNPETSFAISQEEINQPINDVASVNGNGVPTIETVVPERNVFADPTSVPLNEVQKSDETKELVSDAINDDIVLAQIAIEESNVKHYEALAENSKKKMELLKRQLKNTKEGFNLENTASNLFNNNGVLDEEKVLGKTPMPNIRAA